MFHTGFLFASLFWGSIGAGYCLYGRKQRSWPALAGGVLMILSSYLAGSIVIMSLLCLAWMVAVFFLLRRGY